MNPAASPSSLTMPFLKRLKGRSLLSGSAIYLLSNALCGLLPFALLPVLTRHLSTQEYGQVAMFQTLVVALGCIAGLSVAGAAMRKFFDEGLGPRDMRDYVASCLQILVASVLLSLGAIVLLHDQLTRWLDLDETWLLLALAVSAAGFIVQILLGQWQARKRAAAYAGLQVGASAANVALSLLLVVALSLGLTGRLVAIAAAAVGSALLALVFLWRMDLLSLFVWRPHFHAEALKFGLPLLPHTLGAFIFAAVDRFVIAEELGVAAAGIYMVAVQLALAPALVFDALNKAYVPWLFERLKRNDMAEKSDIVRKTYIWFLATLAAAGAAFLAGTWIVRVVAGPGYDAAGDALGWLVLGQVFGGMYLMVTNYVFYSRRTGLLSLGTAACGVLHVLLLLALVRWKGIEGAAIAFAITMGTRFVLTWWIAQRRHPMPWLGSTSP